MHALTIIQQRCCLSQMLQSTIVA